MRAFAFVVLVAACDPGFTLQGDIVDGHGEPVRDAQIVFTCNGNELHRAAPDSTGHFRGGWIGWYGDGCSVEVRRPGANTASFDVLANCTRYQRKGCCLEVTLHAVLP